VQSYESSVLIFEALRIVEILSSLAMSQTFYKFAYLLTPLCIC